MQFFKDLFDTSSFPARWNCGDWTSIHGWVHIVSDLGIFLAYLSIPITLFWFIAKRKDLFFPGIFWLFGSFILLCGFTHLLEAIIFWEPLYRVSALVKACTAIVSLATVVAIVRVLPTALDLPGLKVVNAQLRREIEQRRAAELEARQVREELENILFVASHDLREPVRGIVSFSEILNSHHSETLDDSGKAILSRVLRNGNRLSELIGSIQEISHLREDKRQTEMVNANQAISKVLVDLDPLIISREAKIHVAEDLPDLYSNVFWLERIFYNVINNAIKYAPDGETPDIAISRVSPEDLPEGRVGVVVEDRNETIHESKKEFIFDLFKRNTRRSIEGTGAGLAIVRAAAKRYGGEVWHEPRSEGGNRFLLSFHAKPYRRKIDSEETVETVG